GIMQGLMLNATTDGGTLLQYPNFLETLQAIRPMMHTRAIGGTLYLIGFGMMAYNIWKTAKSGTPVNGTVEVNRAASEAAASRRKFRAVLNAPVIYTTLILAFAALAVFSTGLWFIVGLGLAAGTTLLALAHFEVSGAKWSDWYDKLLEHSVAFTVLTLITAAIGGAIQIIPTVTMQRAKNVEGRIQVPYT